MRFWQVTMVLYNSTLARAPHVMQFIQLRTISLLVATTQYAKASIKKEFTTEVYNLSDQVNS